MKQVIKYAAIFFALMLATSIIGGCLTAGISVIKLIAEKTGEKLEMENSKGIWYRTEDGNVVFLGVEFSNKAKVKSGSEEFERTEITSMDIEVMSGELKIETWEESVISVVYENISEDYEIWNEDGTLTIRQENDLFVWGASFMELPKISIKIPADMVFDETIIEKGSGSAGVQGISTDLLRIESGSGAVSISEVTAKETKLDSGSGAVTVKNAKLGETAMDTGSGFMNLEEVTANNLVIESGSGRVDFKGYLTGNCVFDTGSGSVNVEIYGDEENYNIRADLGSGGLYINGAKEKDTDIKYSDAKNLLVFETGSGRVSVKFQENSGENSSSDRNR